MADTNKTRVTIEMISPTILSKAEIESLYAPLISPALSGTPTISTTPDKTDNSHKIADTAYVKNNLADYLPLTGGTISNSGAVNGLTIYSPKNNYALRFSNDVDKGTAPSSNKIHGIEFYGSDTSATNKRLSNIDAGVTTENASYITMAAYGCKTSTDTTRSVIGAYVDANDNIYTSAPTPDTNDNSTKIATTAYTRKYAAATYLPLTGGTITGNIVYKNANITRGTAPSALTYHDFAFKDSNNEYIGLLRTEYDTNKSSLVSLKTFNTTVSGTSNNIARLGIGCDASGNAYTVAPTPATNDNSTKIATTAYTRSYTSATYLPLTGGNVSGNINRTHTYTIGTAPSSTQESKYSFLDSTGLNMGTVYFTYNTDKSSLISLRAYNTTTKNSNGNIGMLGIGSNSSGAVYTIAPTPATADNSTKIATTAYVKSNLNSYLPLSGGVLTGALQCKTTYTNGSGTTYTSPLIQFNSCNASYGNNVAFGGLSNTIVGSGESVNSQLTALAGVEAEQLYLVSDSVINFKVNCNTWANAKTITLNTNGELSGLTKVTSTSFVGTLTGNCSGTSANVTGTVAIAHGGTGATTRLEAVKALTNENVGTAATHFLTITTSWGKAGYSTVANVKSILGLGSAAYTASTAYAASNHNHDSTYLKLSGGTMTGQLVINKNTGLSATAANACALVIGGTQTAAHIEIDPNEIQAKSNGTTATALYLNNGGGTVYLSNGTAISAANGTFTATKIVGAYYADYAEWFPRGEETEPGDVIVLDLDSDKEQYIKSSKDNKKVVGVHSDNYSHIIGGEQAPEGIDHKEYNEPKYIPVALCGRIETKFIGAAKKGDYVVPSDIPGVARSYKETDNPLSVFGMLVEEDNLVDTIRRLKVKLK